MKTTTGRPISQCQVIGGKPVRTWNDYRAGCLATYSGGHHNDGHLEAFSHGMETVFNLLEAEFPPAEVCKAAPELLNALELAEATIQRLHRHAPWSANGTLDVIHKALESAIGPALKCGSAADR